MEDEGRWRKQFQDTIDSLNESQRNSVLSKAKTLQILAGPGSGKTRVLTCRAAHFVLNEKIKPQQIIVVTFTNKAANEMKKRLYTMIGNKNTDNLAIGTFHAICARLVRFNAGVVGLKSNFTIADTDTSKQKPGIDTTSHHRSNRLLTERTGAIFGIISKAKSEGITAKEYSDLNSKTFERKDIAIIYTAYEEQLQLNNLVDFDNLLMKACELFRKKKNVLAHVKAVLVDEYQDTNIIQYELIKLITKNQHTDKTVTIVGDPDQSIFSFRSAEPENFNKMHNDYSDTQTINMEQNYRSTGTILDSALHVIKQDVKRIDKSLYTNNPAGIPISLISLRDEDDQATFVAKEIKKIIKYSKGLLDYKDFAVLMRMNYISQKFEATFRSHRIPFTIIGGDRFFNRIEIKDILGYLKFAYNNFDYMSYSRIINVPKRGIGDVALTKIGAFHETRPGNSMLETLHEIGAGSGAFTNPICQKLKGLAKICDDIKAMIEHKMPIHEILGFITRAIKYEDYLKEKYFNDHEARWSNIGELISLAKAENYHGEDDEPDMSQSQTQQSQTQQSQNTQNLDGLELIDVEVVSEDDEGTENLDSEFPDYQHEKDPIVEFLEYCSLSANQKEQDEAEGGRVTVSTMHASKGLEWPCVFVVTCCEGVVPMHHDPDVSEEGRLLYVAMTRSQFFLYCITPKRRDVWGYTQSTERTRFFGNMDQKIYITKSPEWTNETRSMLAATIGKPAPPDDDDLVTIKKKSSNKKTAEYSTQYTDSQSQGFYASSSSPVKPSYGGFVSAATLSEDKSSKRPTKRKSQEDTTQKKKRSSARQPPIKSSVKPEPEPTD
ncbi:P-loop containing nucleoside triphosphate hydrolase protein [Mucor lusitanicus]|uniref:DNA 3'-5' helicase n=1 Tax=Mucor circinelloides f. lusitanicus TaxID=29924 RepID=A0A8H4BKC5_MUCCL|nr:P-loop containing nucleoside triphosphate hydrolase protein [Mucor lusitanicus]